MEKHTILKDILGRPFVTSDEHQYYCPYCKHHKKKMSVNIDKNVYKCWICDIHGRNIRRIVKRFGTYEQLKTWDTLSGKENILDFDKLFEEVSEKRIKKYLTLPEEFVTLTGENKNLSSIKVLNYLKNRDITRKDIVKWKIGYCVRGQYQGRVIVPSFGIDGRINYFVARTYTGDWKKYINPSVATSDIIFNHLFIDWNKDVVLVEGIFDAMRAGLNAIPLLGSTLRTNSLLFQEIIKKDASVFVALDEDAKKKSTKIIHTLLSYGAEVFLIDTSGHEDVGSMTKEEYQYRKEHAKLVNPDTFMVENALDSIKI